MNMKVTAVLVIAIALVATLMYSLQQGPSEVPQAEKQWVDKDSQPQPQDAEPEAEVKATTAEPSSGDEEEDVPREEQIAETKAKLDALMLEYNENLKNPEAKKELEGQIALLMDEYNALILPIAVEKVKQTALPKI